MCTASDDKSVKVWSVSHKKFISSFLGHTSWVRCAKYSPLGKLIASCSDDKTMNIFDTVSGDCVHTFKETKGYGTNLAWYLDGTMVAVALSYGRTKIYDIRAQKLVQLYEVHAGGSVNDVAFHPSGNYLATVGDDKTLKILDVLEGRPIFTLLGHTDSVNAVAWSKDGDMFATGGNDKQVWKTDKQKIYI